MSHCPVKPTGTRKTRRASGYIQYAAAPEASELPRTIVCDQEIICVVSVHAATGLEAAAVALAIVADALKADLKAAPSPSL